MSFLISSQRNNERDALSELFYVLSDVLGYDVKPLNSRVPGLSLLSLIETDVDLFEATDKIQNYISKNGPLVACLKIVPLERLMKTNISSIVETSTSLAQKKIHSTHTWRISVKKRQTNIRSMEIIESIAEKIDWGKVSLKSPDYEIRIEIIRNLAGVSVMKPHFVLRSVDWVIEEEK
ncbi:MAG: THUMP domain-containing protein [Candidatus Hodarchaeales archaeon]|jgi:tRNA acetyltransferase TAN1